MIYGIYILCHIPNLATNYTSHLFKNEAVDKGRTCINQNNVGE